MDKEYHPGLAGVPATESSISFIDGEAGILEYRGYRIETLAEHSTFEETAWLLLHGKLPTTSELQGFRERLQKERASLPSELIQFAGSFPKTGHPMAALQASLATLGMFSEMPDFHNAEQSEAAIVRILAATPVLIAAFDRSRRGLEFVAPDEDLDTAAGFLAMINGERPDELFARILDVALILHAEHTMNASTFAAIVVASTEADPYTVCSSAAGALTGPLHGGANERVLIALNDIGGADKVPAWFAKKLANKQKVMGFGHRVYKTKDPRAHNLQALTRELFAKHGSTPLYDIAVSLEAEVVKHLGGKGIYPNVDFFSGIVYQKLGIATDLFTPVFAMARVAGYLAHWKEQMANNRLFRPGQIYKGGHDTAYEPIANR